MQSEQFWAADERAEFEEDARFGDCCARGSNAAQQNEHAHHDLPINRVLAAALAKCSQCQVVCFGASLTHACSQFQQRCC